jgi:hypothetical protein
VGTAIAKVMGEVRDANFIVHEGDQLMHNQGNQLTNQPTHKVSKSNIRRKGMTSPQFLDTVGWEWQSEIRSCFAHKLGLWTLHN